MDPLSVTTSIVALATLIGQTCQAFYKLRQLCLSLPGRLHALNNEVTDTQSVIADVEALADDRQNAHVVEREHASILRILGNLEVKIRQLKDIVEALCVTCSQSKFPLTKARAWSKVQDELQRLQEDIKKAKSELNIVIGAANSRDLLRIRMDVDVISFNTTAGMDLQQNLHDELMHEMGSQRNHIVNSFDNVLEEKFAKLQLTMEQQEHRFYKNQESQLGPYYGNAALQRRRRSAAEKVMPQQLPARADAVGVRLRRSTSVCTPGCSCKCHKAQKAASSSMLDRFMGQLFVSYSGMPLVSPKCDRSDCRQLQSPHINLEYWFPVGVFWSQILRLQYSYHANLGPQFQLSTLRRVSDDAPCVTFALGGNIDGLKDLFARGLASPRDVSTTRGYSLIRWAMYGKRYEACRFLLNAGADPDYRPIAAYDNSPKNKAHDFLLQGGLTPHAEEVLRLLTQNSDWIDEQHYTLIHKVVVGLSLTSLDEAIRQFPDDLDTPDAMGRTPLSWAAARGDERMVAQLLASGADPNTMDIQVSRPLDNAADRGWAGCCRLLLEWGAHPDPPKPPGTKTGSALNCAARNTTDPMTLKTLLDFGADIESCGADGRTSLIHVARTDNVSFALLLLEYGADINATSTTGETPLTVAITHNSHKVLKLLLDRWFEYSVCPRLTGPHLLHIVAKFADAETLALLTETDHLRLKYQNGYGIGDFAKILRDRHDTHEKLTHAFEDLLDTINHEPDMRQSKTSLMEAHLLLSPDDSHGGLDEFVEKLARIREEAVSSDDDDVFEEAEEILSIG